MSKINIRSSKYWKYKIIEYEYKKITYGESGKAIEVCKTLHKTNSKLVFWLIILCLKFQGIKYDIVKE